MASSRCTCGRPIRWKSDEEGSDEWFLVALQDIPASVEELFGIATQGAFCPDCGRLWIALGGGNNLAEYVPADTSMRTGRFRRTRPGRQRTEVVSAIRHEYPQLAHLGGAYFHQDWHDEHATPRDVVAAFKADEGRGTIAELVVEIDLISSSDMTESDIDTLWLGRLGGNYEPQEDGRTYREWLALVRQQVLES